MSLRLMIIAESVRIPERNANSPPSFYILEMAFITHPIAVTEMG
jgi:hypothetical protein